MYSWTHSLPPAAESVGHKHSPEPCRDRLLHRAAVLHGGAERRGEICALQSTAPLLGRGRAFSKVASPVKGGDRQAWARGGREGLNDRNGQTPELGFLSFPLAN